jgi:integrase
MAGHRQVRPSTARSYAAHVRLYLAPALGRIPLEELEGPDVQAMIDRIVADHAKAGNPISAASLARIRATLRCALNAAMRRGLVTANPATMIELPPQVRPHPVVWTPGRVAAWKATGERPVVAVWTADQLYEFLSFTVNDPFHLLWRVSPRKREVPPALSGIRRGEACGLRWADVDLDDAQFMVAQQLVEIGGTVTVAAPKTAASRRLIPLDEVTVAMLCGLERSMASRGAGGHVFTDSRGRPLRPGHVTNTFRAQVTASGLPPVRLHDLRHGAATLALAAGVDLKTVQDMLGHSTIVTTADIYTSVLPQVRRAAAESIADLVLRAGPAA